MSARPLGGWKQRLRGPLLSIAILVALALAAEIFMRVKDVQPLGEGYFRREGLFDAVDDPDLGYVLRPGTQASVEGRPVSINSKGFRDRDFAPGKDPGVLRIVALGDSITFGNGLDIADTWPKRLEERLTAAGVAAEVLNLGVGGYDTLQEVALLERVGMEFDPDVILLAFCVNDVGLASVNLPLVEVSRYPRSLLVCSRLAQWWVADRSRAAVRDWAHRHEGVREPAFAGTWIDADPLVTDARAQLARDAPALPEKASDAERLLSTWQEWYVSPSRLAAFAGALDRLAALGRGHEVPVVFFLVPLIAPEEARAWETIYALVDHIAGRSMDCVLDLRSSLAPAWDDSVRLRATDAVHPGPAGHDRMAAALVAESARWLPAADDGKR